MGTYNVIGTYSQTLTAITVSAVGTWIAGSFVTINYTSGTATDGRYTITTGGTNSFIVTSAVSTSTSGNCIVTAEGVAPKITAVTQNLDAGGIVDLFELNATAIGGSILYFYAGVNGLGNSVVWQGISYTRLPIEAEGFARSGQGTLPRPTIRCANITGEIGALARSLQDLIGAKVIRRRTFIKYLDAVNFTGGVNPTADPNCGFPDEVWFVDRKSSENGLYIEWELAAAFDVIGVKLPRRQCIQNICTWQYRGTECGYTGGAVADRNDIPTTVLLNDSCGKRLDSCKLRFGATAELPFGAFPGVGLLR